MVQRASKKKTAIKLGQKLVFDGHDRPRTGLRLHPNRELPMLFYIDRGEKVEVVSISMNRHGLKANAVWIEVVQCNDPRNRGWVPFDCGGWDEGMKLVIEKLVLVPRRNDQRSIQACLPAIDHQKMIEAKEAMLTRCG